MNYRNYLQRLATAFKHRFELISVQYNFDNGNEFEIALCYVLRDILPQKYGICRGFVISVDGQSAGDDIIIYDRERFPTLRILPQESYDRKQEIPVEAVYAYIEAKNTLHLNDNVLDGQSISKARNQVTAVKRIPRDPVQPDQHHPYFKSNLSYSERPDWPPVLNPMFGAIFARQVKDSHGNPLDAQAATDALVGTPLGDARQPPDLIIAGNSNLIIPCVHTETGPIMHSPFYVEGTTGSLQVMPSRNLAFATGICILLYALDTIQLGRIPWEHIISDGFGVR